MKGDRLFLIIEKPFNCHLFSHYVSLRLKNLQEGRVSVLHCVCHVSWHTSATQKTCGVNEQ